jgi:anti-sigma B factor antagonist
MPGERGRGNNSSEATVSHGELRITRSVSAGRHRLELAGELDLASSEAVRSELETASDGGTDLTVVDLRDLRFIDSTGLSVLFDAVERAGQAGRRIVFTRSSPEVERTLRLTGLDRILSFDSGAADTAA